MEQYTGTILENMSSGFSLFEVQYTAEMNLIIIASRFL
jgi:hypothetical protein